MEPPPDVASYDMTALYEPETRQITGHARVTYHNRTTAPIPDLVWHLYLNAFASEDTLWMREAGPGHRGFNYAAEHPGWVEIESMVLDGGPALVWEAEDPDATLVRSPLPQPLPPGESVTVVVDFTAQLPRVFARTGCSEDGKFVMAGQWFPKLGVWEEGAWNAYPFRANSEFYADFGTYDVDITMPAGWVVGATGVQAAEPVAHGENLTHFFRAEHVIDFAWSASPNFRERVGEVDGVRVRMLYCPARRGMARRVWDATMGGLRVYQEWYGPYGMGLYPQLTVIVVPPGAGGAGGMEYPTLFTVGALGGDTPACLRFVEVETIHELGHQWFQSVVATNEAEEPWLDEGFTDYSTVRAMDALYEGVSTCGNWNLSYLGMRRMEYLLFPRTPMAGKAWELDAYSIATYSKPAVALATLERLVGEEAMVEFLRAYVERGAFAHPTAEDLRVVMAETLGAETAAWFFEGLVYGDGALDARTGSLAGDTVALAREGELCIPSPLLVDSVDGGAETLTWPCPDTQRILDGNYELVAVDPELAIVLDLDYTNNVAARERDWHAWLGSAVRLLQGFQRFYQGGLPW